jgi:tellurite resistance protein
MWHTPPVVLDGRLKKLARGLSARDAADAFATSQTDPQSLRDSERAQAAEFEATIEAMFLMAAVDGEITSAELGQLTASVEAIMDLARKRVDTNKLLAELNTRLGKEGWKARLDAVAKRIKSPEARSFAFRLAAGVAFVDDHVAHSEAAAIAALAGALALSEEESQDILDDVQEALFG